MKLFKQLLKISSFDTACLILMGIMAWQLALHLPVSMAAIIPSGNHYVNDVLINGKVAHWNVAIMPLKVYIADGTSAGNWNNSTKQLVHKAMQRWSTASNNKLKFVEIGSKENADIVISWKAQLDHSRLGVSPFRSQGNSILYSDVTVATHNPHTGEALNNASLYQTILHELGHALGLLGHSPNPSDVMYWSTSPEQTGDLTQVDINTINTLYSLKADLTNGLYGEASAGETRWGIIYALKVEKLLKEKNYAQAYTVGLEGLKKAPTNPHLLYAIGIGAMQTGKQGEAAKYLQKCLQYDPSNSNARHNLAVVLLQTADKRLQSVGADATTLSLYKLGINHLEYAAKQNNAPTQTATLLRHAKGVYARLKTQVASN